MVERRVRFDSLGDMVSFQLRRASLKLQSMQEQAFDPLGLRISEATMLIAIGENSGCTQAELARGLHLQPANVVPTVRKLAADGLIMRQQGDGRGVALLPTPAGLETLQKIGEILRRQEDRIARLLPNLDRADFLAVLRAIAIIDGKCQPQRDDV